MKNKKIWVIVGLTTAALIAVGALLLIGFTVHDKAVNGFVINSSARPTVAPTPTPSPTPSRDASQSDPTPDGGDTVIDTSTQSAALTSAITQFLTFSRDETPAARIARISPFVPAGSVFLSAVPSIARQDKWGMVGFNAVITVTAANIVSIDAETPDKKGWETSVFVTYTAVYSMPGQSQTVTGNGVWHSTVAKSGSPQPTTLTQPGVPSN